MKRVALPLVIALAAVSLVSCAPTAETTEGIKIVASTNVYGSIAEMVAGTNATVTSIIDSPSQDPHSFEASARVELELSRADIVIANGGGYDDFVDTLLSGARNSNVEIIKAVEVSGFTEQQISENEHVWYDLNTAEALAVTLGKTLSQIDPKHAKEYDANVSALGSALSALQEQVASIAQNHGGETVVVTEPVPLYLLAAAGLTDMTPQKLSTAIENGSGVPPAVMNDALNLIGTGNISLLVYNEQTEGPETKQLVTAATQHEIPSIAVTETIPGGQSYLEWMGSNIRAIEEALG